MSFQQRRAPSNVYVERVYDDPLGKFRLVFESGRPTNSGLFVSEDKAREFVRRDRTYWRLVAKPQETAA